MPKTRAQRLPARRFVLLFLLIVALLRASGQAQSVVIVVIDGARYDESFGAEAAYMPRIWNDLRPLGTIYTNFRNDGMTKTCAGHAAVLTGLWQDLPNDGSVRPSNPTVFERFRKHTRLPESSCFVVSGKDKLAMLTYGVDSSFGMPYGANFLTTTVMSDSATWPQITAAMDSCHPRLMIINLPSVDVNGHGKDWAGYLRALRDADSLVYRLWNRIESDGFYRGTTTMFVTNDHGRHDDAHGGFQNHGDSCEGCRHIMLLGVGPGFAPGAVVAECRSQVDIAPTVGEILGFPAPKGDGESLLR